MDINKNFLTDEYAKLAAVLIDGFPYCSVHYEYDESEDRFVLKIEGTGLYLREIRDIIPDNIKVKYGDTQDIIIFIDTNHF